MVRRVEQKEETQDRILAAAIDAFADAGFLGASTRDIAARAGVNQGLITYHFRSKEDLWKAAAERLFHKLRIQLAASSTRTDADPRDEARRLIREYVRFVAEHPQLLRFMMEEGRQDSARTTWLVEHQLRPFYDAFSRIASPLLGSDDPTALAHVFYAMAGAASLLFSVPNEARLLTGSNATTKAAIERHAELVARLIVP